jgi:hypothetical protein
MSTRAMKGLLAVALCGAGAASAQGCADVIGADFNRDFADGGGGSVGTTGGGVTASVATSTGATMGTGAGEDPCSPAPANNLSETTAVEVWAENAASLGQGAKDFFTIKAGEPAPMGYAHKIATYKIYATPGMPERKALYQCSAEGHHHMLLKPVGACTCMGYVLQIGDGSTLKKDDYLSLLRITGSTIGSTALIPAGNSSITCEQFAKKDANSSGCVDAGLFGAK